MITFQEPTKITPLYELAKGRGAAFVEMDGWQVPGSFGDTEAETAVCTHFVGLADASHGGKITVEGKDASAMIQSVWHVGELAIGQGIAISETIWLFRLRQDRFFVNTAGGAKTAVLDTLNQAAANADSLISVGNSTHGNAQLMLIGPNSAQLLSRLCGLDFHDSEFPAWTAKQSSVGKTAQLILRHDAGDVPTYSIIGAASFGAYLWDVILEAGANLGVKEVGLTAVLQMMA
ncbi:MAG: sarcosine oxidase subunit gamma family protein [Chloroflexota bacterium]